MALSRFERTCLPSRKGPVPFYIVSIVDERKVNVISPGQPPPLALAVAMCRKCNMPYVAINRLEEAEPPTSPPIPLVRPGEPVGGTGDL